jgi:hypothetical protein
MVGRQIALLSPWFMLFRVTSVFASDFLCGGRGIDSNADVPFSYIPSLVLLSALIIWRLEDTKVSIRNIKRHLCTQSIVSSIEGAFVLTNEAVDTESWYCNYYTCQLWRVICCSKYYQDVPSQGGRDGWGCRTHGWEKKCTQFYIVYTVRCR